MENTMYHKIYLFLLFLAGLYGSSFSTIHQINGKQVTKEEYDRAYAEIARYDKWVFNECMKNPQYKAAVDTLGDRLLTDNISEEELKESNRITSAIRESVIRQSNAPQPPTYKIFSTKPDSDTENQEESRLLFTLPKPSEWPKKQLLMTFGIVGGISIIGICIGLGIKYCINKSKRSKLKKQNHNQIKKSIFSI